jgi:hypothetical protein
MSFRYRIRKLGTTQGSFTTRPDLSQPLTEEEVIEELVQNSAISAGDVRSVFTNLKRILVNAAQLTRPSEPLFGLFRMGLSSGGTLTDPEQSLTFEALAPSLNLYASADLQNAFRMGLVTERTGVDTARAPDLETVRNDLTGALNTYTPGDVLRISGGDLKLVPTDLEQGVFFRNAAGVEVRAARYITVTDGLILLTAPATLTGPQTLIVKVKYQENLRQTTFDEILAQG